MKTKLLIILFLPLWAMAQIETKISKDSLPILVKEQLAKKYQSYSVSNIIKKSSIDGTLTYKLEAKKEKIGSDKITVFIHHLSYNSEGKLLSKTKDKVVFYTDSPTRKNPSSHQSGDGHKH